MKQITLSLALLMTAAGPALAAGGDSTTPPKGTNTTTFCTGGKIWDEKTKSCVQVDSGLYSDDVLYAAAREMAYAGQYDHALMVLDLAANQSDSRILNYKGFVHRKLGDMTSAMAYYEAALTRNPDYILARSYMGQGLVAQGDYAAALAQLREIDQRGGRDTWAYAALEQALTGVETDY